MDNFFKDAIVKKADSGRPGCKKCGLFGHFAYQCRNDFNFNKPNQELTMDNSSTSSESNLDDLTALSKSNFLGDTTDRKLSPPVEDIKRCEKSSSGLEDERKNDRNKPKKKKKRKSKSQERDRSRSSHRSKRHKRKRSRSRTRSRSRPRLDSRSHSRSRKRKGRRRYSSDS